MYNVKILKCEVSPTNGVNSIIPEQYHLRRTGEFIGDSSIVVYTMLEPVWWNRPFSKDVPWLTKEADGLWAYNLPFFGMVTDENLKSDYKSDYNLLLNTNSVGINANVSYEGWTKEEIDRFEDFMSTLYYDSLVELGADTTKMIATKNDIIYDGKKISGKEVIKLDYGYSEDGIITLEYQPEKEIFDRLTGKYALKRGITGISEEEPHITRDMIVDRIYNKVSEFLRRKANG